MAPTNRRRVSVSPLSRIFVLVVRKPSTNAVTLAAATRRRSMFRGKLCNLGRALSQHDHFRMQLNPLQPSNSKPNDLRQWIAARDLYQLKPSPVAPVGLRPAPVRIRLHTPGFDSKVPDLQQGCCLFISSADEVAEYGR